MRALVTGGAGFIGSHLVDALVERGDEVHVIDDLSSADRSNLTAACQLHEIDVADPSLVELVAGMMPATIYHLAANISVPLSISEPGGDARHNVAATASLMKVAADVEATFVFASSAAVYAPTAQVPAREPDAAWPVTPYGAGKLAAEMYLHAYASQSRLRYSVLRFANVYGPRQGLVGEGGVVAVFCQALADGRRPMIHGDGEQNRDFIYVGDVVAALLRAAESPVARALNVSTGTATTINRVHALLARHFGATGRPDYGPARPGDVRSSALDPALAQDMLGWVSSVPIEDGLARTAEWFLHRAGASS